MRSDPEEAIKYVIYPKKNRKAQRVCVPSKLHLRILK